MTEGALVLSSSRGRYSIGDSETGPDITSGDRIAIRLGGNWISGTVEHAASMYAVEDASRHKTAGYHFVAEDGSRCGLCAGMEVKFL